MLLYHYDVFTFFGSWHAEFGCRIGGTNDAARNIVKTKFVGLALASIEAIGEKFARKNGDFVIVPTNAHFSQIGPITWQEIAVDDSMTFS